MEMLPFRLINGNKWTNSLKEFQAFVNVIFDCSIKVRKQTTYAKNKMEYLKTNIWQNSFMAKNLTAKQFNNGVWKSD